MIGKRSRSETLREDMRLVTKSKDFLDLNPVWIIVKSERPMVRGKKIHPLTGQEEGYSLVGGVGVENCAA